MVRDMKRKDWERVAEIYRQGVEEGQSTFNTKCPDFEKWDSAHRKECRLVYEINNTVVGFAALSPVSKKEAYRGVAEVSIYIDKSHRKNGIGTRLLKALCVESEKHGYWTLHSVIFSSNETSIALHKKCGFRMIGYQENIAKDRFGKWQSVALMERRNDIF